MTFNKDLEFIKEVLEELIVDPTKYNSKPTYEIAIANKKLALIKINRLIREKCYFHNSN